MGRGQAKLFVLWRVGLWLGPGAKGDWFYDWTVVSFVSRAVVCNDTLCDGGKQSTAIEHHEVAMAMAGQKFSSIGLRPRRPEAGRQGGFRAGSTEWSEF